MSGFKVGEHVTVTIKGRVTEAADDLLLIEYATEGDIIGEAPIVPNAEAVAIERTAPAEWPPQPGDLWRDKNNDIWFAADVHDGAETDQPQIVMVFSREDYRLTPDEMNQRHGQLTLVHRDGADKTDGEEPEGWWTAPDGKVWNLHIPYIDDQQRLWRWAGGYESKANSNVLWPLMSSTQAQRADVPLCDCPELKEEPPF